MKNIYIYIRVSTDEQATEGFSMDNQKRACVELAQSKGCTNPRLFIDDGKSARTADRKALQELLALINEQTPEAVIFYKIDRFARNLNDFTRMYSDLKNKGIKLISVMEGDLSEGTSLVPNIFASVAQWESEVNSQRTKDALMQKFREGWQPTPPPMGYRSVGGDRERKSCVPDEYLAPIIKQLFELYATGSYSILELQDWLSEQNVTAKNGSPLGHNSINIILNNPFYHGLIRWHGQSQIGNHRPIISKELYDTCQYVLAKHRNFITRRRKHDFLLRGFAYCTDCGQRYTAEYHYNEHKLKARGGKISYYHCQKLGRNGCPSPYVETNKLEQLAAQQLKKVQFTDEFKEVVVRKTKEKLESYRSLSAQQKQAITNQKVALELKRNRLEDELLESTIDRETFKRKHGEIQDKILNLNSQMQEVDSQIGVDVSLIEEVLSFTRDVHRTYTEAPDFLKKHYLRFFFEKLMVKDKKVQNIVPTPIFATLLENKQVILTSTLLARWDDYRKADWSDITDCPDLVMVQTHQLLSL